MRFSFRWSVIWLLRHRKVKRRALVDLAFCPDEPAMSVDDALHGGQPDAGPLELVRPMQPLKWREEFFRLPRIEACAVIADEENRLTIPIRQLAKLHHRHATPR